jgi:hypothetical protein
LELKNFSLTDTNIYETIWFMHAFLWNSNHNFK